MCCQPACGKRGTGGRPCFKACRKWHSHHSASGDGGLGRGREKPTAAGPWLAASGIVVTEATVAAAELSAGRSASLQASNRAI